MLVLTRKLGEKILIGDDITITVVDIGKSRVKLGIEAPAGHRILREELAIEVEPTAGAPRPARGCCGPRSSRVDGPRDGGGRGDRARER